MAAAAAAASGGSSSSTPRTSPSSHSSFKRFVPKCKIQSSAVRDLITEVFRVHFRESSDRHPTDEDLKSRKWCALKLLKISKLQSEQEGTFDEALPTLQLANYLLKDAPKPHNFLPWSRLVEEFGADTRTAAEGKFDRQAAALVLEETLQVGGQFEILMEYKVQEIRKKFAEQPGYDQDLFVQEIAGDISSSAITSARAKLLDLAGFEQVSIALPALDALYKLLTIEAAAAEEVASLSKVYNSLEEILNRETEGKKLSITLIIKLFGVLDLVLDRQIILVNSGEQLPDRLSFKRKKRSLVEYFEHKNIKDSPEIAAFGALVLEKLKWLEAPIDKLTAVAKVEESAKSVVDGVASGAQSNYASAASQSKKIAGNFIRWAANAKYLARKHLWAGNLNTIIEKKDGALSDISLFKEIQHLMNETFQRDASNSFAYFCVEILIDLLQKSSDHEVLQRAFCFEDQPSIAFFCNKVRESWEQKIEKKPGFKKRLKSAISKSEENIWENPRLLISLATALHSLKNHKDNGIANQVGNFINQLENLMSKPELKSSRAIYENGLKRGAYAEEYRCILSSALFEVANLITQTEAKDRSDLLFTQPMGFPRELDFFVGRTKELSILRSSFLGHIDQNTSFNRLKVIYRRLWGPGGFGKTQTAIHFLTNNNNSFSFVWWINCENMQTLEKSYRSLPTGLKQPDLSPKEYVDLQRDFSKFRDRMHEELEKGQYDKPWLLIFDELDSKEIPLSYPKRGGCVLVTSRFEDSDILPDHNIQLKGLSKQDCRDLLTKFTPNFEDEEFDALYEMSDGYPTIVDRQARYIRRKHLKVSEYLNQFEGIGLSNMLNQLQVGELYLKSLWQIINQQKGELLPSSSKLLDYIVVMGHTVTKTQAIKWLKKTENNLQDENARDFLNALIDYSLVEEDREKNNVQMHSCIRAIIEENMEDATWGQIFYDALPELLIHGQDQGPKAPEIIIPLKCNSVITNGLKTDEDTEDLRDRVDGFLKNKKSYLFLFSPLGYGKTTFIKQLYKGLVADYTSERKLLPVLCDLRTIQKVHEEMTLTELIHITTGYTKKQIEYMNQDESVLILDGVREIDGINVSQAWLSEHIGEWNGKVIVVSRIKSSMRHNFLYNDHAESSEKLYICSLKHEELAIPLIQKLSVTNPNKLPEITAILKLIESTGEEVEAYVFRMMCLASAEQLQELNSSLHIDYGEITIGRDVLPYPSTVLGRIVLLLSKIRGLEVLGEALDLRNQGGKVYLEK